MFKWTIWVYTPDQAVRVRSLLDEPPLADRPAAMTGSDSEI